MSMHIQRSGASGSRVQSYEYGLVTEKLLVIMLFSKPFLAVAGWSWELADIAGLNTGISLDICESISSNLRAGHVILGTKVDHGQVASG